jgi:hypothetical protein
MITLVSGELWDEVGHLAWAAPRYLAAIAYVSKDDPLRFGEGDVLVTDASRPAGPGSPPGVVVQRVCAAPGEPNGHAHRRDIRSCLCPRIASVTPGALRRPQ